MTTNGLFGQEELQAITRRRPSGKPSRKNLRQLIDYQEYRCAVTGVQLTPKTASADHIIPVSKGGENTIDNIQIVHREVNRMKGALTMREMYSWCQKIIAGLDAGDMSSQDA